MLWPGASFPSNRPVLSLAGRLDVKNMQRAASLFSTAIVAPGQ